MLDLVNSKGFTVIEAFIAAMIFSTLLLISTYALLQVGHVYYKDQTESNVQNVARSIIDTIAQDIEFSSGAVALPPSSAYKTAANGGTADVTGYAFCTEGGIKRYSILLGHELDDSPTGTQTKHVLVEDTPGFCTPGSDAGDMLPMIGGSFVLPATGNPRELLSPHMRLALLTVSLQPGTNLYNIHVRVVYGDDDLLNSAHDTCLSQAGSQFCSVSDLTTSVLKRVP